MALSTMLYTGEDRLINHLSPSREMRAEGSVRLEDTPRFHNLCYGLTIKNGNENFSFNRRNNFKFWNILSLRMERYFTIKYCLFPLAFLVLNDIHDTLILQFNIKSIISIQTLKDSRIITNIQLIFINLCGE